MKSIPMEPGTQCAPGELDAIVDQTEQLLKSVAQAGNTQARALTANVEQGFATAAARLEAIRTDALARAGSAARATDEYVHVSPWRAVGIAAAAAAVAGLIAGILLSRRPLARP